MPTHTELAHGLGYKSVNSIQQYLRTLRSKGYLDVEQHKSRGVKLIGSKPDLVNVPLVGRVACGCPIFAEENIEAYIPIDKKFVGNRSRKIFFLMAQGDSMDAAGINDKDFLLIESRETADPNNIVVALIGDEATVKYFKPGNGYVALVPKSNNPKHRPIILTENISIQGVVKKVFKKETLVL